MIPVKPCAGSTVLRIDLLCFLAGCGKRRLNQTSSVLYLGIRFSVCCYLLGPLFVYLRWYVFCLLVVLVKLSVLAN